MDSKSTGSGPLSSWLHHLRGRGGGVSEPQLPHLHNGRKASPHPVAGLNKLICVEASSRSRHPSPGKCLMDVGCS